MDKVGQPTDKTGEQCVREKKCPLITIKKASKVTTQLRNFFSFFNGACASQNTVYLAYNLLILYVLHALPRPRTNLTA